MANLAINGATCAEVEHATGEEEEVGGEGPSHNKTAAVLACVLSAGEAANLLNNQE